MTDTVLLPAKPRRIQSLGALKAIAAFLIFYGHSTAPNLGFDVGTRMCEFFFVASGFLTGYNDYARPMEDTSKARAEYFFKKLAAVYPLHVLCLCVRAIDVFIHYVDRKMIYLFLVDLFLFQAWSPNSGVYFSFNGVAWFLDALMFCYLLAPFLLRVSKKIRTAIPLFLLTVGAHYLLESMWRDYNGVFMKDHIHVFPVARAMQFFMGMLLVPVFMELLKFVEKHRKKIPTVAVFTLLEAAALVGMVFAFYRLQNRFRLCFVLLFCVFVFLFAVDAGLISKLLSFRGFRIVADVELEFFLMHQVVMYYLHLLYKTYVPEYMKALYLVAAVDLAVTLGCAWLYHKFLGKPLRNLMAKGINKIFALFGSEARI